MLEANQHSQPQCHTWLSVVFWKCFEYIKFIRILFFFCKNAHDSLLFDLLFALEFKNTSLLKLSNSSDLSIGKIEWVAKRVVNVEKATEMSCFHFFSVFLPSLIVDYEINPFPVILKNIQDFFFKAVIKIFIHNNGKRMFLM